MDTTTETEVEVTTTTEATPVEEAAPGAESTEAQA